jgi:hypothetical protein
MMLEEIEMRFGIPSPMFGENSSGFADQSLSASSLPARIPTFRDVKSSWNGTQHRASSAAVLFWGENAVLAKGKSL